MKRILQIAASLKIGGAEKVCRDIGLSLNPAEYEVHYIVFGEEVGDYEPELIEHNCKIFHWPSPSGKYHDYLRSLRDLMRANQYYAVHAHTMFNIGWVMLAARQCGVPVRVAHAHSALDSVGGIKKRVYENAMRFLILQNATHLVACGEAAGIRLFGEKAYRQHGHLILNGIDTKLFAYNPASRDLVREKLHLVDSYVIGHVGHLAEVKNQSFLIRLMPDILKRMPNAKLLLLGEGEDRPMLEQQIRDLNLTDSVIMTGNVRNVPDYLSAMDVFAFPSLFEGMPLSIIEVQANGLSCVLSTGVPKDVYLTDLVHSLPLDKPDAWVEAICSTQRNEPEKYADDLKTSGFDTEIVMQKFWEIYEKA